jgi:hypothetical protein
MARHNRRLDYIFLGGPVVYKKYAQVTSCRVILDQPGDNGVWATGHFGVLADIETVPSDPENQFVQKKYSPPVAVGASARL